MASTLEYWLASGQPRKWAGLPAPLCIHKFSQLILNKVLVLCKMWKAGNLFQIIEVPECRTLRYVFQKASNALKKKKKYDSPNQNLQCGLHKKKTEAVLWSLHFTFIYLNTYPPASSIPLVLVLAGTALIFFIVAGMWLSFGFHLK